MHSRTPNPVDVNAGRQLRARRKFLGISQETLAENSGVSFQQVQKYENGVNRISVSRLWEFAVMLKVPISYFFEGLPGDVVEEEMPDPVEQRAKAIYEQHRGPANLPRWENLSLENRFHRALIIEATDVARADLGLSRSGVEVTATLGSAPHREPAHA